MHAVIMTARVGVVQFTAYFKFGFMPSTSGDIFGPFLAITTALVSSLNYFGSSLGWWSAFEGRIVDSVFLPISSRTSCSGRIYKKHLQCKSLIGMLLGVVMLEVLARVGDVTSCDIAIGRLM